MDIKLWVDKYDPGAVLIPFSTAFENKILDMDEAEREAYLKKHQVTRLVSTSMVYYNNYYVYPVNVCGLSRSQMRKFNHASLLAVLNPVRFAYVARLPVGEETPQDCRKKRLDVKSGESVSLDQAQVPTHLAIHRVIL